MSSGQQNLMSAHELDVMKRQNNIIISDISETFIRGLQEELAGKNIEQINAINKKYEQQIATLKEDNEMKLKEIDAIHVLEWFKLINMHNEMVKSLQTELELCSESADEKIRISELQTEQRLKALETQLGNEQTKFVQCRDNFETEIKENRREYDRARTTTYNCQLALKNTRSTVANLMDRLKKSDSEVEILKSEVKIISAAKLEAETKFNQISVELQHLRQETEDLSSHQQQELDVVKRQNHILISDLAINETFIRGLQEELAGKNIEQINAINKKYEQQIATLNEHNEMKLKEIDSIHVLERFKLINMHNEMVKSLQTELELCSKSADEKIRISKLQTEQLLKSLETQLDNEQIKFVQCRDNFETEIKEICMEYDKATTESCNYKLSLKNTRSTVANLKDRLKKSDSEVEILKSEVKIISAAKLEAETKFIQISEELQHLRQEAEDYRNALNALRNSSLTLERKIKEKESVFEQFMSSEENTMDTESKIGKLFNDKIEENIGKYFDLYTDLRTKYDAREKYIIDMKPLMDELGNGIQLARMELDAKEARLLDLQKENKTIKLESLTYKFKCELFEKNNHSNDGMMSNELIANIINQLESETLAEPIKIGLYSDDDKISAENNKLKANLAEKSRQVDILQAIVKKFRGKSTKNRDLNKKLASKKSTQTKIAANTQLKIKIANMQLVNKELQSRLVKEKDVVLVKEPLTPTKMNMSHDNINSTPKTPRNPKSYAGKENHTLFTAIMAQGPNVQLN